MPPGSSPGRAATPLQVRDDAGGVEAAQLVPATRTTRPGVLLTVLWRGRSTGEQLRPLPAAGRRTGLRAAHRVVVEDSVLGSRAGVLAACGDDPERSFTGPTQSSGGSCAHGLGLDLAREAKARVHRPLVGRLPGASRQGRAGRRARARPAPGRERRGRAGRDQPPSCVAPRARTSGSG